MTEGKTVDEITSEVSELIKKVVGNLNNLDSKKVRADITLEVLNDVIAGVELSKIEKAGTLIYLERKRIQ